MTPPSSEVALIQSTATALSSIATTAGAIVGHIRQTGMVRAQDRERLKNQLASLKREDIANKLANLQVINLNHMFTLYDLAERRADNPQQYARAVEMVEDATRMLSQNFHSLARELE